MAKTNNAVVLDFPKKTKQTQKRKRGVNVNKDGSVRNINGKIYVDFYYLGERVRESSGLPYNETNLKTVRGQLDRITVGIKAGTFRFADVFPNSQKKDYFTEKEINSAGLKREPEHVICGSYIEKWYDMIKSSGRIAGSTLLTYKIHLKCYLIPYFGKMTFLQLNHNTFNKFIGWARKQKLHGKEVGNDVLNKCLACLKQICKSAALEYGWGSGYNPFFGFKILPVDAYEKIQPFSLAEQQKLLTALPNFWKPYFQFAFSSGLRQGEQIGLKAEDIDWKNKVVHIRRAITTDENAKIVEGQTKTKYSKRSIKLLPTMLEALKSQKKIYDRLKGEYFFCTPEGHRINRNNLNKRVWLPALKKAELGKRAMRQTRHSFITLALSVGENPLWIAKTVGHRDSRMINTVYAKYVEDATGTGDGIKLTQAVLAQQETMDKHSEK
jgi:integrase